ncbi:MAG: glutamine synthetase [Candidatus Heimdallarchaeota archaeon]|nr:MAG: glutamine synthetase [Candidatus Heimdallarchaeota archaeon]
MASAKDKIIRGMEKIGAKYILLQFTGADGHLKGVEMSKRSFSKADHIGVDGSSIGFLRTKQSDMIIVPDPTTVTLVPWQDNTACVFCDLRSTDTHEQISADPRGILAQVNQELIDEFKAVYFARPEMEFYILTPDLKPVDSATYMGLPPRDKGYFLRKMIVETLDQVNIPLKTFHSEVGSSQHEIEFEALPAVQAADSVQYFKQISKMVALNHTEGWIVTFMPKPFVEEAGTGMHIHQMVKTSSEDLFKGRGTELTEFALHFIAGQLKHATEITAITNPIINSYRRLIPRKEAPVYVTWGIANRTALIRVPGYEIGRLEYRAADASANIYFLLALLLAAGIEGVKKKLEPPEEADFDADALTQKQLEEKGITLLPRTLFDALRKFQSSKLAERVLGPALHQEYYQARMQEWQEFTDEHSFEKQEVTNWEMSRYLDY